MPKDIEDENSFDFFYGQDLEVLIIPEVIKSDESIRKLPPEKRNCYFEGEKELKMFKIYTRRNCEMECLAEYYFQENRTQCVPYYVLRNETHPICPVHKTYQVIFRLFNFYQHDYRSSYDKAYIETCGCLDTCNDVQYSIETFETKIKGKNKDYDNATMTVTFRYKNEKFLPLVRRISFTFEDFLCQAGGLLGLYAGISALSVVELTYFITIRPLMNFYLWGVKKIISSIKRP
jgi:amiloride-sensitive sodium channel